MATRAALRGALRERLEDDSATPLWSDAALNEYLANAIRSYGARFPRPATGVTGPLALGATSAPLPQGIADAGVVAVRDARGRDVPRMAERPGPAPDEAAGLPQAWRVWAGTLRLQRPTRGDEAGVWQIDHLAGREPVDDDGSAQPIEAGDEPIVVALAAAQVLERRAVEDAKRGTRTEALEARAAGFRAEAERLTAGRKRRARGGFIPVA
jgi:hypothetical protein